MAEPESQDLIERVRRGDEPAMAQFVDQYQAGVRRYAAMRAPSQDEADDIAQEVFLVAFRALRSRPAPWDAKPWLLGIARNLTRQAWRRSSRFGPVAQALDEVLEEQALAIQRDREPQYDLRRHALHQCIAGLPVKTREFFYRYVVDEFNSTELAELMRTITNSARAFISRVRHRLRECIERRVQLETHR